MNKSDIIQFLKENKKRFLNEYDISTMVLFGSYARGENYQNSDIDIAIKTPLADYFKLYDFKEEIEKAFGVSVDIVRLREKMNPMLRKRIEQEGIYV